MTQARVVREPKQQRTREAWNRVLDVGLELFIDGGLDALTISEVCRRAEVSAPSLYARVDGLAGLVAAVYDHAMIDLRRADIEALHAVRELHRPQAERIALVVNALADQFAHNASLLRPVIAASLRDDWVHDRGIEEAQRVIRLASDALDLGDEVGFDIATMLFSELVIATMYGADFASPLAPDDGAVRARLVRMATARAEQGDAGR